VGSVSSKPRPSLRWAETELTGVPVLSTKIVRRRWSVVGVVAKMAEMVSPGLIIMGLMGLVAEMSRVLLVGLPM